MEEGVLEGARGWDKTNAAQGTSLREALQAGVCWEDGSHHLPL